MPDRLSFIFRELLDVHKPRSGDRMPAHGASHGFAISGRTSPNGAMGRKTLSTIPRHSIMPAAKKSAPNEALYDKLIATIPEIERKGDANPYTSLNGNMFTLLHQSRLAIRLPENERDEFLKKYQTNLFEAYATVMKEYVAVPDDLLPKTKELKKYLELSYSYAKTLKPKPTKKTK
jgi:hypothetical protein